MAADTGTGDDERLSGPTAAELSELGSHFAAGRHDRVEAVARDLVRRWPEHPAGWKALGAILGLSKRAQEAVPVLQKAVQLAPEDPEAYNNLGSALWSLGRVAEAEAAYRSALSAKPGHFGAQLNLASLLHESRRLEEAASLYREMLASDRGSFAAHFGLGSVLLALARFTEAEQSFSRALEIKPDHVEAHGKRGVALRALGRLRDAEQAYRAALALRPESPEMLSDLAVILADQGKPAKAEASLREALAIRPHFPTAQTNLGNLLWDTGRLGDAEVLYRSALSVQPDYYDARNNLGTLLRVTGRLTAAEEAYRLALAIRPDLPDAHNNLGNAVADLDRLEEAKAHYQKALELRPGYTVARSNLLYLMAYRGLGTAEEYLAAARQWESHTLSASLMAEARGRRFGRPSRQGRRLRVGYVSGDLKSHPVSMFMEPIFEAHDRSRFEVTAYYTADRSDPVLERMRGKVEHWHSLHGLTDDEALQLVLSHDIDVLVDLSGHTNHNRLGLFARRAAPVQCHYLGYFASTGVSQMDYWIGDEVMTPESIDSHFSETVWRLPRCWVAYRPPSDAPAPNFRPEAQRGICLGSFNNLAKVTQKTLDLWARVLAALPDAFLLLKTKELNDPSNRERIAREFARRGIPAGRLELRGPSPGWPEHMSHYDRVDIALDPAGGIGGGTTSCETLWMCVPIVTLYGARHAERMTASMLAGIGQPDLIARDEDEYIRKVVQLAKDHDRRYALRKTFRERMARSILCDFKGMAAALEQAYERMFDIWREGAAHQVAVK